LPTNYNCHPQLTYTQIFHLSQLKKHLRPKEVHEQNLPLVTPDGYIKVEPVSVLDTRALPQNDDIITQWLVQWENLGVEQVTWEDKLFIKSTFPSFYYKTLQEWGHDQASRGQEASQGGGSCQDRSRAVLATETIGQ
jgi:hypothetical protein